MTFEEIQDIINNGDFLPVKINSVSKDNDNNIVVNDRIVIPVEHCASYFEAGLDLSIFDDKDIEIGRLLFTKELGEVNINSLTEDQFIAFLREAPFYSISNYRFSKNYVILEKIHYQAYVTRFAKSSAIWGGFVHFDNSITTTSHSLAITNLKVSELGFPSNIFIENAARAILQPFAFERFLKLYHLLELRFDFDVINKIKNLNVEIEPEKIGDLLNDYSNKEIKRLESLLFDNCANIDAIVGVLNKASQFVDLSYDLFYKFGTGKEGNPFNGQEVKLKDVLSTGFEQVRLETLKINFSNNYKKFILKVTAYFIYRTRSSIAHNKIGEYILSMANENYIVEFAEPLLREVLIQCFRK